VALSAGGLPAGATATFAPQTTTNTSTLTLATATTTTPGSYPITITGNSGNLNHTTSVTLVVNSRQDFSLSASPTSLTLTQGQVGSYAVTITRTGGFTGAVTLSVTGQGAGTTAIFYPNPATGNSSYLIVAESFVAATGTFTLEITGTSGTLSHTVRVTLIVNPAPPGCSDVCN
jgi:hypothetical protein